ncbi:MAG: T9SS type A sorting domain-containing protein [Bacteroidetes bacterium]|nr:T9SS type A sorting domain-containing protein [Bacteroidota bacterium]
MSLDKGIYVVKITSQGRDYTKKVYLN